MRPKRVVCALFLLAMFAGRSSRGAEATVDSKPAPAGAAKPSEVARRVFEGSQFWWKRRATVEEPAVNLGFLSWLKRPIAAVFRFIGKVISGFFWLLRWLIPTSLPGIGTVTTASSPLMWGLGAIAIAVIALIVYQLVRRRRLADENLPATPIEEVDRLPDAVVLMERAKAALEAGDTFEALRLGFLAILAGLQDRGIVRYDPARTNSEYFRDLRRQPKLAADFRRIALPFDRAFYGKIRPERSDVERALEFCQSLMTAQAAT
jgi:hypothetical protein